MIVVTGGAGFIGQNLVLRLAESGQRVLIVEDVNAEKDRKMSAWMREHPNIAGWVDWTIALDEFEREEAEAVYHLGAISDTSCTDLGLLFRQNTAFTHDLFDWCTMHQKPLIYASSASVYGTGQYGFSETCRTEALNDYAESKAEIDYYTLLCGAAPPHWYGLRFFNVYGPHEGHKGDMRSFALKAYDALKRRETIFTFDVNPLPARDFVHVDDCVDVMLWLMQHRPQNGIYNVGTGNVATFETVATMTMKALGVDGYLGAKPMPDGMRERYQFLTRADITKLREAGYTRPFMGVAEGVRSYVAWLLDSEASALRQR